MTIFTGTAGNDVLPSTGVGNGGDDALYGLGGNDTLFGGAGVDLLQGGDGDDILRGGAGADVFLGGAGRDLVSYVGSAAGVTINLTTGIHHGGDAEGDSFPDTIEWISGSNFADLLIGAGNGEALGGHDGADRLVGMAGNDALDGGAGTDLLDGGDGDDRLTGGTAADSFLGGDGIDRVSYTESTAGVSVNLSTNVSHGGAAEGDRFLDHIEILHGSLFADTLIGTALDDVLFGEAGNDDLQASAGNDKLRGQAGDDRLDGGADDDNLVGGAGADSFLGGAGIDTVSYDDSTTGIQVNLATNANHGGSAEGDRFLDSIEIIIGSGLHDVMVGGAGSVTLDGLAGDDQLQGAGGNDVLRGGSGADRLSGMVGNDLLVGGAGADVFTGGAGIDTVSYADSFQSFFVRLDIGFTGRRAEAEGDRFLDLVENAIGGRGHDSIIGNILGNTLRGGEGNDQLTGLSGDDLLIGGAGSDTFRGDVGIDTVSYADSRAGVTVTLARLLGSINLGGDAFNDRFVDDVENGTGSAFADSITGNILDNTLNGDGGDDRLSGWLGADRLIGGGGADRFVYAAPHDSVVGANRDVIADFSQAQADKVDLSLIDADAGAVGNQAFTFIGSSLYTNVAGQLRYAQSGGVTTIAGDVDGDGASDFHIALTGAIALAAVDFVL